VVENVRQGLLPWPGWTYVHYDFSYIPLVSFAMMTADPEFMRMRLLEYWLFPYCAFVIFAFFGLTKDARRRYRHAYLCIARRLGCPEVAATATYVMFSCSGYLHCNMPLCRPRGSGGIVFAQKSALSHDSAGTGPVTLTGSAAPESSTTLFAGRESIEAVARPNRLRLRFVSDPVATPEPAYTPHSDSNV